MTRDGEMERGKLSRMAHPPLRRMSRAPARCAGFKAQVSSFKVLAKAGDILLFHEHL
jgi:hypothetical protein